ncbi:hypothetical protein [Streptomyces sp. A30]|uniref:hypothetical protein n=1 Tax=Streptomyces sp. A30 TaxID=2789273 RepID=UPI00397F26E5
MVTSGGPGAAGAAGRPGPAASVYRRRKALMTGLSAAKPVTDAFAAVVPFEERLAALRV